MTAQDAFAIAFDDEVWAMDAIPGMSLNMKTPKPAGSGLPKTPGAAKGMGGQTSMDGEEMMTLAEHDEKNHKGGYKGGRCTWRDKHGMSGMTLEEAMSKGLANKKFPAGDDDEMPANGQPQQPQMQTPEMQEQIVQQMAQNPQMIETAQSQLLTQPEELETSAGEIPVQTTVQKAIVENLEGAAATGDPDATKALGQLKEKVDDGEITASETQPTEGQEQPSTQAEGEQVQQPEQPRMEFTSSDGSLTLVPSADTVAILQNDPSKKEEYQKIVDTEAALQNSKDDAEKKDISDSLRILKRMFYGTNEGVEEGTTSSALNKVQQERIQKLAEGFSVGNKDADGKVEILDKNGKSVGWIKADGSREVIMPGGFRDGKPVESVGTLNEHLRAPWEKAEVPKESPEEEPPKPEPPKPEPPQPEPQKEEIKSAPTPEPAPEKPQEEEPSRKPLERKAPSDDEFRVKGKENEYKIGGMTYVDVSGKGLLRTMVSSFIAGLQGKGIITGWDRISGTWDQMKRSEKGEMVRGGIEAALANIGIDDLSEKVSDPVAKAKLDAIKRMIQEAKNPTQEIKAYNELEKWREEYGDQIADMRSVKGTGGFEKLAQKGKDWKAPPISVFPPVSKDERDTSYMEKMEQRISDRIKDSGIPAEIIDRINGSSVVQFKVKRLTDGTDKALADALKAMQADIGAKITYTPDTTSGEERLGTITINNDKVKDASMQRLLEDEEAVKSAMKMEIPLLLGETAEGKSIFVDLKDHGFMGGDSGSGKSERIIGAVSGAFAVKSPSELQVVFNAHANDADYEGFEDDPHTGGIGKTVDEVAENLANANEEWKRRQKLFAQLGVRNIADYNKAMDAAGTPEKKLPSILVITDEVTDLLAQRPELANEIDAIVRNGRKFGVAHLGATQDMGADNMPSTIKGATRMGVQSGGIKASDKIFDVHAPELANLNRKGDLMVKMNGQLVRLRGTYADEATRKKLREYNTGKIKAPAEEPSKKDKTPEAEKPAEEKPTEGGVGKTAQKIEKVEDVDDTVDYEDVESLKAYIKRLDDAKKEVSKKYSGWNNKAKRDRAIKPFLERIAEVRAEISNNFPGAEIEDGDVAFGEEEESNQETTKENPQESLPAGATEDSKQAMATMQRLHKKAIEKLDKRIENTTSMRESAKLSAERKALEKRFSEAKKRYEAGGSAEDIINIYEPEEAKQDNEGNKEDTQKGDSLTSSSSEQDQGEQIQSSISLLDDDYSKKTKEVTKNPYLSAGQKESRLANLKKKYNEKLAAIKAGKSIAQIEEEEATAAKTIKDKIPVEMNGKPIPGARHILESSRGNINNIRPMEKGLLQKALANLPEGFEIDSDTQGRPLWDGQKAFARNPKTGVYGKIRRDGTFVQLIDPLHPNYKGPTSAEARAAMKAYANNKDESKDKELLEKANLIGWGVPVRDEAPDNATIVANAVAQALELMQGD